MFMAEANTLVEKEKVSEVGKEVGKMKPVEVIGTITDYNPRTGEFKGTIGSAGRMLMAIMYDFVDGKQWRMIFGKFYKLRTTGEKSQSHRLNGFIQQICEATGNDFDAVKDYLKRKAIGRGLRYETAPDGVLVPISETRMTTIEIGYVIAEAEQLAAEEGIWLYEGI